MNDIKNSYEFTFEQNAKFSVLVKNLIQVGIVTFITGLLFAVYIILQLLDYNSIITVSDSQFYIFFTIDYAIWVLIALLIIYLSIMIIRLTKPIKLIISTSGMDLEYLFTFITNMNSIAKNISLALIIISALIFISIIFMILIF